MSQIPQIVSTSFLERVDADQIERVGAVADFAPSFDDLLDSGEPELMRGALRSWLARGDRAGAGDVYEEWLKAGGEPELIRESLLEWLAGNATAPGNATAERPASSIRPGSTRRARWSSCVSRSARGSSSMASIRWRASSTALGCRPVARCRRSRRGSAIGWPRTRTMRAKRTTSTPRGSSMAASRRSSRGRSSAGWPLMHRTSRRARSAGAG